jgi:hypothetical protein
MLPLLNINSDSHIAGRENPLDEIAPGEKLFASVLV